MKKLLIAILAVIMIVPTALFFVSCDNGNGGEVVETTVNSDVSSDAETTPAELPASEIKLIDGKTSVYKIVRSENASATVSEAVGKLTTAIHERIGGSFFMAVDTDWIKPGAEPPTDTLEILIGDTNRAESSDVKSRFEKSGYYIGFIGKRLVIQATGEGLLSEAISYLIENYLPEQGAEDWTVPSDLDYRYDLVMSVDRENWTLGVPAFPGGELDPVKYSDGQGITLDAPTSYLQIINKTDAECFDNYIQLLTDNGYSREFLNTIGDNRYACYYNGAENKRVYFYYIKYYARTTVIEDKVSCSLDDFCFTASPASTDGTEVYSWGLNGSGQLMLFRLADGSWIVNDGGTINQVDLDKLYNFMREKSGTASGAKLKIACWYVSHAHQDHIYGFSHLVDKYHASIDLERVMWNFPDRSVIAAGGNNQSAQNFLHSIISKYYPSVKYLKPHTGMKVTLGEYEFEFLVGHEDAMREFYTKEYDYYNDTCMVPVVSFSGIRMFLPGDSSKTMLNSDYFLCKAYAPAVFCCELLQVSHHGYNGIGGMYNKMYSSVEYAIFPNTYALSVGQSSGSSVTVYNTLGKDKCFFNDKTYGFKVVNGKITVTEY